VQYACKCLRLSQDYLDMQNMAVKLLLAEFFFLPLLVNWMEVKKVKFSAQSTHFLVSYKSDKSILLKFDRKLCSKTSIITLK